MKTIVSIFALSLAFAPCCVKNAWANRSPYVLEVRASHKSKYLSVIRLRHRKTQRLLWTRSDMKDKSYSVNWSKNRRAVTVEYVSGNQYQILVWREGYRLRNFAIPGSDYTMGIKWSPDNRRLLIRGGASGSIDMDAGRLYCLTLGRWPHYRINYIPSEEGVRTMAWKDNRTVVYGELELNPNGTKLFIRQRVWRVPGT